MADWMKFYRKCCTRCLSPACLSCKNSVSPRWRKDRTPIFRVVTRVSCDHVCKTPSSASGPRWPLMVMVVINNNDYICHYGKRQRMCHGSATEAKCVAVLRKEVFVSSCDLSFELTTDWSRHSSLQ